MRSRYRHAIGRVVGTVAMAATGFAVTPALPASAGPGGAAGPAFAVVLQRTGGFAGGQDVYVVTRGTDGGARTLRLAGSSRFRWLRSSYRPDNACCDRYEYRLTASYRNGTRKTVTATEGAPAPRILWDVIETTQQVGEHTTATTGAA